MTLTNGFNCQSIFEIEDESLTDALIVCLGFFWE